ncbi:hypothetical protein SPTER_07980 [Sporomusa termitida]|uniref:Uncharacterized protein n=1 Tax=Sporomusa termitida TaxID=2377 RepID=A0A517DQ84_9FIRM|nr:hypothetical protein SPTER_07980 [Sporomusa termitida]
MALEPAEYTNNPNGKNETSFKIYKSSFNMTYGCLITLCTIKKKHEVIKSYDYGLY